MEKKMGQAHTCKRGIAMRSAGLAFGAALCAIGFGTSADARGTLTRFDPRNSVDTIAIGINDDGAITGWYQDSAGGQHGFVRNAKGHITTFAAYRPNSINGVGVIAGWSGTHGFVRAADGTVTFFDPAGSSQTYAFGLNDKGAIAGDYEDSSSVFHGYVRAANGKITSFDPAGSTHTEAFAINNKGAITGFYYDCAQAGHGYVRAADGTITTFDPSGSTYTEGDGINKDGVIAGHYRDDNGQYHGYVRAADGTITVFDPTGSCGGGFCDTFVSDINTEGTISGLYYNKSSVGRAYVRTADGKITTFAAPNAKFTNAEHINDNGVVAGWFYRGVNSDEHGFFWSR